MRYYRPTWAEIDLGAIRFNFGQVKAHVSAGVKIMAVVKANAYGHGIVEVARTLESNGVDYLGVAMLLAAWRKGTRRPSRSNCPSSFSNDSSW